MEFLDNLEGFRRTPIRDTIVSALDYSFLKNSPQERVRSFLERENLADFKGKIRVVGFGKAGKGMYEGARQFFGSRISSAVIIVPVKEGEQLTYPFLPGNHPFPGTESIRSSKVLIDSLAGMNEDDLVLVLVSGGGSALFENLRQGVELEKYNEIIDCLMRHGANISELNSVRYLFSMTKGGSLLNFTYPARVLSLIVSDVPGDSINTVSSGPTGDPPSSSAIDSAAAKYGEQCGIHKVDVRNSKKGYKAENHIVLKNQDFVKSILENIQARGFRTKNIGSGIQGDTTVVSELIVNEMRSSYNSDGTPLYIAGGGETSTNFTRNGIGGRNLELALKVLLRMEREEVFTFGSIGTDGIDGTSKAMGAIVDNKSLMYVDENFIREKLSTSDSLAPLIRSKDVLLTGPTGNNVSDIFIGYYAGKD
ncbi:MAG: DUF4147 domain-containing protein [Thermoplasmatales archaeon]|nr:DUF4147 domain-containing protein [Thermoplasmatales archaeon]